jgi:hypothetical protein
MLRREAGSVSAQDFGAHRYRSRRRDQTWPGPNLVGQVSEALLALSEILYDHPHRLSRLKTGLEALFLLGST